MPDSLEVLQGKTGGQGVAISQKPFGTIDSMMGSSLGCQKQRLSLKLMQWAQVLVLTMPRVSVTLKLVAESHCLQQSDDGEDVSYTVELIVFDYTIAPFIELSDV